MDVVFQKRKFKLVVTEHARQRMVSRGLTLESLIEIIESGSAIRKKEENKYWVYKTISGRSDNTICLSIAIEPPNLVVITALINWRPHQ